MVCSGFARTRTSENGTGRATIRPVLRASMGQLVSLRAQSSCCARYHKNDLNCIRIQQVECSRSKYLCMHAMNICEPVPAFLCLTINLRRNLINLRRTLDYAVQVRIPVCTLLLMPRHPVCCMLIRCEHSRAKPNFRWHLFVLQHKPSNKNPCHYTELFGCKSHA